MTTPSAPQSAAESSVAETRRSPGLPPAPGLQRGNYHPLFETRIELVGAVALVALLVVLSMTMPYSYVTHLSKVTIFALAAMGLNLLTGNTGLISIAHAAYMGIGAFFAVYLLEDLGLPFMLAVPAGGVIAGAVGLMFGLPSLRLAGVYLVMASFAAQMVLFWFFEQARWLTKGAEGRFLDTSKFSLALDNPRQYYLITLAVAVVGAVVYKNILRSGFGRAMEAVRERPSAAQLLGVNLLRTKLVAFAVGHFYAGLAGALYAWHSRTQVATKSFSIEVSIELLAIVIVGGLGRLSGAVLGAIFIVLLPELLAGVGRSFSDDQSKFAPLSTAVFGLLIVLFLLFEPKGLAGIWDRLMRLIGLRKV